MQYEFRIQNTFIRQQKHVDKHKKYNPYMNIEYEYTNFRSDHGGLSKFLK